MSWLRMVGKSLMNVTGQPLGDCLPKVDFTQIVPTQEPFAVSAPKPDIAQSSGGGMTGLFGGVRGWVDRLFGPEVVAAGVDNIAVELPRATVHRMEGEGGEVDEPSWYERWLATYAAMDEDAFYHAHEERAEELIAEMGQLANPIVLQFGERYIPALDNFDREYWIAVDRELSGLRESGRVGYLWEDLEPKDRAILKVVKQRGMYEVETDEGGESIVYDDTVSYYIDVLNTYCFAKKVVDAVMASGVLYEE